MFLLITFIYLIFTIVYGLYIGIKEIIDPNFIQAKLNLGKIYINLKNYQCAIPYLEEVVNKIPLCGTCWLDLGEAYLRYGAKTKAKEALETAKSLLNKDNKNLLKIEKLLDELNNK